MSTYKQAILSYAPENWTQCTIDGRITLQPESQEYLKIKNEILQNLGYFAQIGKIERIQNVHDYGQVLIMGQLLAATMPNRQLYRVRRYIKLPLSSLDTALRHNLDYRRCGCANPFAFTAHLGSVQRNEVILIVQIITFEPGLSQIFPKRSLEYFIEYVVHVL